MNSAESIKILLLTESAENHRRWADILCQISDCVWSDSTAIPEDLLPEVVVTDNNAVLEGDVGVIRIGDETPADVNLAPDASPGELRLAARLLAEIVRLRRRELDITALQRRFYTEAFTDHLTGLSNRRAWDQALRERMVDAVTDSHCLCLAVFDLDHFKEINDAYGHAAGDEVLKSAALAICESLRQDDFIARIGGDEFGLLFWVEDLEIAPLVVERVRASLPERLKQLGVHHVTSSAGLACISYTSAATTAIALYASADEALRRAKKEGRDRTVVSR